MRTFLLIFKNHFFKVLFLLCFIALPVKALATDFSAAGISYLQKHYPHVGTHQARKVLRCVNKYSEQYGVPRRALLAVICTESSLKPTVINQKNMIGMGQINPKVWCPVLKKAGIITNRSDLLKTRNNIEAAAFILAEYYRQHKYLKPVLRAYAGSQSLIVYNKVKEQLFLMNKAGVPA